MAEFTFEVIKFPGGIHSIVGSTVTVLTKTEHARLTDKELRYRINNAAHDFHIEWEIITETGRDPILKCKRISRKWDKNKMNDLEVATNEFVRFIANIKNEPDEE